MRCTKSLLVRSVVVIITTLSNVSVRSQSLESESSLLRDDDISSSTASGNGSVNTMITTNVTIKDPILFIPEFVSDPSRQEKISQRNLLFLGSDNCPPPGFDAKSDFDVDLYFGRWYTQKQIPVAYQTVDQLYCVTATYTKDTSFCIFCNYAPRIDILNQARQSSVDGEKLGGANRFFRGIIRRPRSDPAKITVGFLAPLLIRARYWVVAAGSYADILLGEQTINPTSDYEWAIITGGPPSREGSDGKCKPSPGLLNYLGMWLFVRDSIPPVGVIAAIDTYASSVLNLDTSAWIPVQHEGCVYD